MTETTEVRKCPVCDGTGIIRIRENSISKATVVVPCRSCNGTGIITTDIVTPFSRESEQFPDKEIFRFGTEKFDEVVEDSIGVRLISGMYIVCFNNHKMSNILDNCFNVNEKVKISCKPGKVIIERVEK